MGRVKLRNWLIFLVVICLDQVTKVLACASLQEGVEVPIIPGLFNLTLVFNPGAAFGMFGNLPDSWRRLLLILVSLIALLVVLRFILKEAKGDAWAQGALAGILAGAVGNIIDRIRFDAVVDFLDFYWGDLPHWPAFNVADSAISVGVFILVFRVVLRSEPEEETGSESSDLNEKKPGKVACK